MTPTVRWAYFTQVGGGGNFIYTRPAEACRWHGPFQQLHDMFLRTTSLCQEIPGVSLSTLHHVLQSKRTPMKPLYYVLFQCNSDGIVICVRSPSRRRRGCNIINLFCFYLFWFGFVHLSLHVYWGFSVILEMHRWNWNINNRDSLSGLLGYLLGITPVSVSVFKSMKCLTMLDSLICSFHLILHYSPLYWGVSRCLLVMM